MKYNTIGSSSLSGEGKKSTLTIYADLDIADKTKESAMESEVSKLKEELLQAKTALDRQTRRCRQLVEEFTRKLQEKESLYKYEKNLREDQLAKVLRALLLVEARLKQEQKLLSHQLKEKDFIIQKQQYDLKNILSSQYCKNCGQYSNYNLNLESLDSSSEYIVNEYQESNFGSLDSSSELCTTPSDKDSSSTKSNTLDDAGSNETKSTEYNDKSHYKKNKGKDSLERKIRKFPHRKSVGSYFEVLKLRNENASPYSNEDNTSNDYDNFDSLPPESVGDRMSVVSRESDNSYHYESLERIDTVYNDNDLDGTNNLSLSESNITVIHNTHSRNCNAAVEHPDDQTVKSGSLNEICYSETKLTESIPIFDEEGEPNDKWYVSASDQEDEQQKNVYRNNPVLECVNQILLQNINDSLNSPPKTPYVERKSAKNNKKVKFSDEKILIDEDQNSIKGETQEESVINEIHNYYETPIQKVPNFYETPQSIYSNDYEQILSKYSDVFPSPSNSSERDKDQQKVTDQINIVRKYKKLRTPPALPPKPTNLILRNKFQQDSYILLNDKSSDSMSLESEPDYCSISELNLPVDRINSKKTKVVVEINASVNKESNNAIDISSESNLKKSDSKYMDSVDDEKMVMKAIDKMNIQVAKQTTIGCEESSPTSLKSPSKLCHEIPKLPLVSEIIIPEESDKESEEVISQDNYVKNNTQILKTRHNTPRRRPISIGSSVSSLIIGFNNRELLQELNPKFPKTSPQKKTFSNFENVQSSSPKVVGKDKTRDDFNLIQNFEEFKLDDCEIEEYVVNLSDDKTDSTQHMKTSTIPEAHNIELSKKSTDLGQSIKNITIPTLNRKSLELLKQHLEKQNHDFDKTSTENKIQQRNNEPTYEHFLECTGLSSKSILTPSRLSGNHKTILKPMDLKHRSNTKGTSSFSTNTTSIKYWSEPFI